MFHELEHEARWVLRGGVDTDERYKVLVPEATVGRCLLTVPLPMNFSVSRTKPRVVKCPHRVGREILRGWVETVTLDYNLAVSPYADIDIGNFAGVYRAITHELDCAFF